MTSGTEPRFDHPDIHWLFMLTLLSLEEARYHLTPIGGGPLQTMIHLNGDRLFELVRSEWLINENLQHALTFVRLEEASDQRFLELGCQPPDAR